MLLDAAVLFASFLGAFTLRLGSGLFLGPAEALRSEHLATLLILLPFWILIHGMNGLYRPRIFELFLDHAAGILKAVTLGCLLRSNCVGRDVPLRSAAVMPLWQKGHYRPTTKLGCGRRPRWEG